jgi:hypothetical protein
LDGSFFFDKVVSVEFLTSPKSTPTEIKNEKENSTISEDEPKESFRYFAGSKNISSLPHLFLLVIIHLLF